MLNIEDQQQAGAPQPAAIPKKIKKFRLKILPFFILAVILFGAGAYIRQNPQVLGATRFIGQPQIEPDEVILQVGKIMELPADEKPTVATVSDLEKLKGQAFFKNAQNGDKVLIYTGLKKAILFRPSTRKIIEVGAVNVSQTQQQEGSQDFIQAEGVVEEKTWNTVLFNGTSKDGLASANEKKVKEKLSQVNVVKIESASKNTYEKTLVVDLTNTRAEDAQKIADALGATVSKMPDGEKMPTGADFLVILGADQSVDLQN